MKITVHFNDLFDEHIFSGKRVECSFHLTGSHIRIDPCVSYLTECMYALIRASGSNDIDLLVDELLESGFYISLHGSLAGLDLPPVEFRSVVFYGEFEVLHKRL